MSNALSLQFELVTPERVVLREQVFHVILPTLTGEITVLPNHIPLVSIIKAGVIELKKIDGTIEVLAVSGGLIEVLAGKIVVLADTAENAAELDESRIDSARAKAEKLKAELTSADRKDFTAINLMLDKEFARARAVKKWRKLKNIETIN